jgi:outer membrane protein TolC
LARTANLPRADLVGQVNRSTHNNVFGMLFPQGLIPSISGPVLGTNSMSSVWGSAVGMLVQWEPFDFGQRQAGVVAAQAARERAQAHVAVSRLQASASAADAFLSILAAQQMTLAAQAGVERARVLDRIVTALVKSELRPGADASRTRAELALAETQAAQAQQAVDIGRAALGQVLGIDAAQVTIAPGKLLELPSEGNAIAPVADAHPLAVEQHGAVAEAQAREKVLAHAWAPKFNVESAMYARGTGIQPNGTTGGAASGLGPNIQNWGAVLNVTFPLFDLPGLRARREIERYRERAEEARYEQTVQDLRGEIARAQAMVAGARRVAANTPVQVEAASAAESQATARYQAGLGTLVEVAEAQRLHTQAGIDDALAKLAVWRALLALATAQGDLTGLVQSAK